MFNKIYPSEGANDSVSKVSLAFLKSEAVGDEHLLVLNLLVEYLKKPDKKKLYLIEDTKLLMKSLTNILANT